MKTLIFLSGFLLVILFWCIVEFFSIPHTKYYSKDAAATKSSTVRRSRTQLTHVLLTDLLKEHECTQSDVMGRSEYHPELLEYKFHDRPILIKSTVSCSSQPIPVALVFIRLHWSDTSRRNFVCS